MTEVQIGKDNEMASISTGAENVRWDLSFLYSGLGDPQLNKDCAEWLSRAKQFKTDYRGKLHDALGKAILDYEEMSKIAEKIGYYFLFRLTLDTNDEPAKTKKTELDRAMNDASGDHLSFFTIELAALSDEQLQKLYEGDAVVARYRSWIEKVRLFKPHQLTEEVESALTKRGEFGSSAWSEFYDELESELRFTHEGEEKSLEEILSILSVSKDAEDRAAVLRVVNDGLKKNFAKYSAQTLNMVIGEKAVEDRERGYKHPMEARNKSSLIPDSVVEAQHKAVADASVLYRRYYRLKAAHLGLKKLRWSDRNAPMPFADTTLVPWQDAMKMVVAAFESFSPTAAKLVRDFEKNKWIDAPVGQRKRGGAYSASGYYPQGPVALTMLNYLGSTRDVMVVAHEFGHSVHGMLAGEAQGPLMMNAPMAYCETASVFAEMVTFDYLKRDLAQKGNKENQLALIMGKLDDMINTVVRQIGFSNFERRIHAMDGERMTRGETRRLSVEEFSRHWIETRAELYGADGDVFLYGDDEYLWAYVGHFHRPFYVYAYAFGELLTHSLYAKKNDFGDRFEPLYLDLLRSGGTKNVVELLKPFGLDPTNPNFWADGIKVSIGALLKEAETLSEQMGVKVS